MVFGIWGVIDRLLFFFLVVGFGVGNWYFDKGYENLLYKKGYLKFSIENVMWIRIVMVKGMV